MNRNLPGNKKFISDSTRTFGRVIVGGFGERRVHRISTALHYDKIYLNVSNPSVIEINRLWYYGVKVKVSKNLFTQKETLSVSSTSSPRDLINYCLFALFSSFFF